MQRKHLRILGVIALGLILTAGSYSSLDAQELKAADFYRAKSIKLIVTDAPGGTPDIIARMMGPYFKQHSGANVVITNERGGGGLEGVVNVKHARPDGLTLGVGTLLPIVLNKIMGEPGADYEPEKFSYIAGIFNDSMSFCVAAKGPYSSIADLKAAKNIKLGGTSPAGNISLGGMSVIKILGLDAMLVTGSKGTAPLMLSIQQGEVAGAILTLSTALRGMKNGAIKPLFVLGTNRESALPGVPALSELVQLKADGKRMVDIWNKIPQSRVFFSTPGTPQNRISYLREIVSRKIFTDPSFRERIDKIVDFKNEAYLTGGEMQKNITSIMKDQKEIRMIFQGLIDRYRG